MTDFRALLRALVDGHVRFITGGGGYAALAPHTLEIELLAFAVRAWIWRG